MDDFLLRALLAGLGLAVFTGPLGAFVVWRRMAYFGDTLAHSGLLGVGLGILIGVDPGLGIIAACVAVALLLVLLRETQPLAHDTLLGILAHGTLALGLIAIAVQETARIDLLSYLFGDILAVTMADIYVIYGVGALALATLAWIWRPLLAITIHEELARAEGVPVLRTRIAFILLMAVVVALAMKLVGILLVTALLVIPAASARRFARTPEQMAVLASAAGCLAVVLGLEGSVLWDLPAGPAIVAAALAVFAVTAAVPLPGWRRARGHPARTKL
jgi:zinc transport system permease protein